MITPSVIQRVAEPGHEDVKAELARLGLSAAAAADLLRINLRTMQRYLQPPGTSGATPCPFAVFVLLRLLNTKFSVNAPMHVEEVAEP